MNQIRKINNFIKHKHVIDIKFITCTDDMYNDIFSALIMYENTSPTQIKQKTFDEWANDDEINEFMKKHDVIKVEHQSYTKKRRINCLAGLELPTKKPDIDNIAKIVMDGMNPKTRRNKQLHKLVKVMRGVYQDDQQVTYLTVKKRYAERARVEVRVKEDEGRQDENRNTNWSQRKQR